MRKILTNSIIPPNVRIMSEDPDEGSGGTAVAEPASGKPGAAFSAMIKSMSGDEPAPEKPEKKDPPKEKEKTPPADASTQKPGEKAAEKAPEKKKSEKTATDPLLSALTGGESPLGDANKGKADAPVEKTPEQKAADVEAAIKGLSPKAAENFKNVVASRDAAEAEAARLRTELASAKAAKPELPAEVKQQLEAFEALKKEHGQMAETLERIGVERSPGYQQKFVRRRADLLGKAKANITRYGGDAALFAEAMELQGRERSEKIAAAMENMQSFDQQKVTQIVLDIENLDEEGASFLENSRKVLQEEERIAQAEEQAAATQMLQARRAKFIEVANTMLHKFPDDHPMAAEANPLVDQAIKDAQSFLFERTEFEDFAKASITYALFPKMQANLQAATKKILELETQLEAYVEADPGNGGSGGAGGGEQQEPEVQGLAQRYVAAVKKAG